MEKKDIDSKNTDLKNEGNSLPDYVTSSLSRDVIEQIDKLSTIQKRIFMRRYYDSFIHPASFKEQYVGTPINYFSLILSMIGLGFIGYVIMDYISYDLTYRYGGHYMLRFLPYLGVMIGAIGPILQMFLTTSFHKNKVFKEESKFINVQNTRIANEIIKGIKKSEILYKTMEMHE